MKKQSLTLSIAASTLLAFSLLGAGCKKEEPKTEAPASTTEPAKAPEPAKAAESSTGIYKAQIVVDAPLETAKAGATIVLPVKVKNVSAETWPKDKAQPINLSYHWRNAADGKAVVWDGTRSFIPKDVAPGEEVAINAKVTSPKEPGKYVFELDMVKDGQDGGWFGKKGSEIKSMPVTVK